MKDFFEDFKTAINELADEVISFFLTKKIKQNRVYIFDTVFFD